MGDGTVATVKTHKAPTQDEYDRFKIRDFKENSRFVYSNNIFGCSHFIYGQFFMFRISSKCNIIYY